MKEQNASQLNPKNYEFPLKGHVYCKVLFDEVFLPILKERFPDVLSRLSAGVIGLGSDVLGADDELSRDHDWGPSKCQLLLSEQDIAAYGTSISQALEAAIPDAFLGIETAKLQPKTIRISTIDAVYRDFHESAYPPVTIEEWAAADDNDLYYASSGFVLYDPSNALSERISAFQKAYYPPDIWKWKIASDLWGIWHNGDYNSSYRLAKRGDGIGLLIGQGAFVECTLRLLCLLNRRFPVYWKWLHWEVQSLPKWMDIIGPSLKELESANNHKARGEIIHTICQSIREILYKMDLLPDTAWRNFMGSQEIAMQIESTQVKALIREEEPHLYAW